MTNNSKKNKLSMPMIILTTNKGQHHGILGSYCWDEICVDYVHPAERVDYSEKLILKEDEIIAFKIINIVDPDELHVTIFSGHKIILHQVIEKQMKMHVPKGIYFLNAKATWRNRGDVSNIFLIEII